MQRDRLGSDAPATIRKKSLGLTMVFLVSLALVGCGAPMGGGGMLGGGGGMGGGPLMGPMMGGLGGGMGSS